MKTFVCSICGHIEFDMAPEKCPVCGAPKTSFSEKSDAIHKPGEPVNFSEPEKKHIPKIVIVKKCGLIPEGCIDAHVRVGEIEHLMLAEHYINFIDFYIDRKYISRVYLTPGKMHPAAALHLKADSGVFGAIEHCNLHGYWMSESVI